MKYLIGKDCFGIRPDTSVLVWSVGTKFPELTKQSRLVVGSRVHIHTFTS